MGTAKHKNTTVFWIIILNCHFWNPNCDQFSKSSHNGAVYVLIYLIGFAKTVTFSISRNTDLKYWMGCGSLMVQYGPANSQYKKPSYVANTS